MKTKPPPFPSPFPAALPPLAILLVFLASAAGLFAGPIADTARRFVEDGATAGVVFLVADDTKTLDCEAVGFADIASAKPMRNDTLFWIASMTKPMTGACIMMLVDEGKVSLDDPVSKYIPEFDAPQKIVPKKSATTVNEEGVRVTDNAPRQTAPKNTLRKTPITLRHLLCHTSGLPRVDPDETPYIDTRPLAKAVPAYARLNLLFEPGTSYSYSSIGIGVLGRVVEVASGIPYETFLQKRLLDPLGMTDTTFWPTKAQLERLATSYRGNPSKKTLTAGKIGNRQYPLDDRVRRHPTPGGGLFSTAHDVARFGQLLLNKGVFNGKRLISEASINEMTRRQAATKSSGLTLSLGEGGRFGHSGAHGTNFAVWPKEKLVTVFMVQRISKWGTPDGKKLRPALEKLALKTHSAQ
ncbi:CubicO group peptidase (beta-lactamase class C family) [Ereboglobus sp. PH5-5]|uniref:serine hydrolase domain-containing protein n=1 Tax=Ereboglobus sp. PH5-5 TaxID=2940529 RepID=UPI002405B99B|nr:serine hydrolase domain-containing protein [Ereboglobus sp. PH5-5]MDF9833920.1 CubicO group peptidase (beta-lactamase class C family) [Ereboglobus sp. PH5-5]